MDHLSSCYFCGTTLDDTLRDYRVVPVELRETDDATTATLCQSCHGKLERLLAPVVEAAGGDGATLDVRTASDHRTSGEAATGGADSADTSESPVSDEDATEDADHDADEPSLVNVEANLVDIEEETPSESDGDPPFESDEGKTQNESAEGGGHTQDEDAEKEGSTPAEDTESTEETVHVRHETGDVEEEAESESESEAESEPKEGGDETDVDGEDGADEGERAGTGEGEESETARTTVSALEYNKVMRLLQNREFPVDRREFETVAANAYGLAEHECGEVIDLAIDRGLVAERDGQLVRPD